jgi:hypothetical protein
MFRIVWTSLVTGEKGHGEAIFTEEQAQDIANRLNERWASEIHHGIEKYESPGLTLNVKGHRCSYGDLTFVGRPSPIASASQEATPLASASPRPSASLPLQPSLLSASVPLAKEQFPQPQ